MTDFYREVDATVAGALNPGEEVIWTGHCLSRLAMQRGRDFSVPPALIGYIVAIVLVGVGALTVIAGSVDEVWREAIVGAVLFFAGGWFLYGMSRTPLYDDKMYCRKQTVYVLTDQRAFVLKHCRTKMPMRSIPWRYVDDVRAEWLELDDRGTVRFLHWDPVGGRWDTRLQFYKVGNAHRVAEWAQAAMMQANG
jgi:hypothetical protein